MTTATESGPVMAAVDTLLTMAPPERRDAVRTLQDRIRERRLRVLVAGEAKRGKSTLLNRILDRDVLPTGALPVTAVATTVRVDSGSDERITVRFTDGRQEQHPLAALSTFVSENENPGNRRSVVDVVVTLREAAAGVDQVDLVDTPGTGSVFEHNTDAARRAYDSLDAVLVVLSADPPVSASEAALLSEVAALAVRTFVLVNKTDQLEPEELAKTIEFTQAVVDGADVPARVWPISARTRDRGLTEFLSSFRRYLHSDSDTDVLRAVAGHAARLAAQLRDETTLVLAASRSNSAEHRDRVARFADRIAALAGQASTLRDTVDTAQRRAIRELTNDASLVTRQVVTVAQAEATAGFDGDPEIGPAEREVAGRQRAVEATVTAVESWRGARAAALQRELQRLTDDLNSEVEAYIGGLREDASTLLGVDLMLPADSIELRSDRAFWYATDPPMSWDLPGAQLARYHGPGAARRARRRLIDEVARMAGQQVGRARGDLQQRFADTVRRLTSQLATTHTDLLTQLRGALSAAEDLASRDTRDAAARRELLVAREATLAAVYTDLTRLNAAQAPD